MAKKKPELEEEPNFNCKSYHQWEENDGEDVYWDCRKGLVPKDADRCPLNCSGFKVERGG